MIRLSAAFSYLSILKEWKAELALLADLQRMVYPQKVTRQLYVEGQGKIASQRPMFYHCVMSPTDYVTNFFWILRLQSHTNADAKRILLASLPADWRRQPGRPRITLLSTIQQDLKQHHLMLPEAADLAQNGPLWRMMSTYGTTQSQSCMPETTTTMVMHSHYLYLSTSTT